MSTHLSSVTLGTPSLEVMVFVYPCREAKLSKHFCGAGPQIAGREPRTQRLRIFPRARSVRKNVLFSEFLVSHTTSRRRLPQTVSYSSAHSSASPFPVGTPFLRRREQIAWFTATYPVLFRRPTSSHRCSSKRLEPSRDSADNCGGSAGAWGPYGDSAGAFLGQI